MWNNNPISLITNTRTAIRVYSASKIPKHPKPATKALQPRAGKELEKTPTQEENMYVSYFYHKIDKGSVPQQEEYELMVGRSANVKQKFSLLQDVEEGKFADVIVQACRDPFDQGDKVTLYVTDYTQNNLFFNYTSDGVQDLDSGSGDMYGYTSKTKDSGASNKWVGPYGKMAMQITAWEPHANVIRDDVEAGDWVQLKNVQIKMGRDGNHLEGAMREARNLPNTQRVDVQVYELDDLEDEEAIDPRLKDAVRRWRDYRQANKRVKTLKAFEGKRKSTGRDAEDRTSKSSGGKRKSIADATDATDDGASDHHKGKRKHATVDTEEPSKPNSKARRKQQRAEAQKRVEAQETEFREEVLGLNPLILCESPPGRPFMHISSILEQQYYETAVDGDKMRLPVPFVNAKYCANVRVVDFHPERLEDFARPCPRKAKASALDILSDDSGNEAASSSEGEQSEDDRHATRWEWRFALLLEDVSPKAKEPKRLWAVVDNNEAQLLTFLDASNLRKDEENLGRLREKMFTLWGTLEEYKHWELAQADEARKRPPGVAPPPSMSDDEDRGTRRLSKAQLKFAPKVSNKPFTCCLRQYGVRKTETNPALANADERHRWQRLFGLFGTKIRS